MNQAVLFPVEERALFSGKIFNPERGLDLPMLIQQSGSNCMGGNHFVHKPIFDPLSHNYQDEVIFLKVVFPPCRAFPESLEAAVPYGLAKKARKFQVGFVTF